MMSKRRITIQQTQRIAKKQQHYQDHTHQDEKTNVQDGLVITRFKHDVLIESDDGTTFLCASRPNLPTLVSGDKIVWQTVNDHQGVVLSLYPRTTVLGRPDKQGVIKPIAANITQMLIVIAPVPEVSWSLLDSYLVVAQYLQLKPTLILNKIDLECTALKEQLYTIYKPLGYSIIETGQQQPQNDVQLDQALAHHTSVFVGQSGVGKSSLIKKILPDTQLAIGPVSAANHFGQHTTSQSYLYHLPKGGILIDSPGVREFGLWHMTTEMIAKGFLEFRPYLHECKFRNCKHIDDVGCAIIAAEKNGLIHPLRYKNYVKVVKLFT